MFTQFFFCGKKGIRTPDTLLTYTRFPGVPLQPLEHLSKTSFWDACWENGCKLRINSLFRTIFSYKSIDFFSCSHKKHDYSSKKVTFYTFHIT